MEYYFFSHTYGESTDECPVDCPRKLWSDGKFYICRGYDTVRFSEDVQTVPPDYTVKYSVRHLNSYSKLLEIVRHPHWVGKLLKEFKKCLEDFNTPRDGVDDMKLLVDCFNAQPVFDPEDIKTGDTFDGKLRVCDCGFPCTIVKNGGSKLYFKCAMDVPCKVKVRWTITDLIPMYKETSQSSVEAMQKSPWLLYVADKAKSFKSRNCFWCGDILYRDTRVVYRQTSCNLCWDCLVKDNKEMDKIFYHDWMKKYHSTQYYWNCVYTSPEPKTFSGREMWHSMPYDSSVDM